MATSGRERITECDGRHRGAMTRGAGRAQRLCAGRWGGLALFAGALPCCGQGPGTAEAGGEANADADIGPAADDAADAARDAAPGTGCEEEAAGSPFGFVGPVLRQPLADWLDYLPLLHDLGVRAVRNGGADAFIQVRTVPPFDFGTHDAFATGMQAEGIAPFPFFRTSTLPSDLAAYERFVAEAAERYDGDATADAPGLRAGIRYWMTEPEPDHPQFWEGTPEEYAVLVDATIRAVRRADPGACVVLAGTKGTLDFYSEGGPFERILARLDNLPPAGPKALDVVDFHLFGTMGEYRLLPQYVAAIRDLLDRFGYDRLPVWITETSTYAGEVPGFPPQSEREQAAEDVRRHVHALALGVRRIFRDGPLSDTDQSTFFGQVGLRDIDNRPRLSYFAYKLMVEKLDGSDWRGIEAALDGAGGLYAYRFARSGRSTYVVWLDDPADPGGERSVSVELPDLGAGAVLITTAIPAAASGGELAEEDYPGFFPAEVRAADGGVVALTLGLAPVYVEPSAERSRPR